MTTRTATRLLLGGLIVLSIGLNITAQLQGQKTLMISRVPSVGNPGPLGLEAAYTYLSQRQQGAVLDAPGTRLPAAMRVLVTAVPYAQEAGPEERSALWQWVEQGGTLVVLGQHSSSLGGLVPPELTPDSMPLTILGRQVGLSELGSDIQTLIATALKPEELVNIPAYPALPDPLLAGVEKLGVSADKGLRPRAGETVPLALAGDTPVLEARTVGKGTAYFLAGPDVFSNARLDRNDNLRLLANLAARGTVYFDEYHHRLGASESVVALIRALRIPFGQLLLLGAVVAWALGRRLGPLRPLPAEPSRTTRDYATQVGQLYRMARAEAALCEDLTRELRGWVERRLGLSPGLAPEVLEAELRRRDPQLAVRAIPLLQRLRAVSTAPIDPETFATLSRAAVALKQPA